MGIYIILQKPILKRAATLLFVFNSLALYCNGQNTEVYNAPLTADRSVASRGSIVLKSGFNTNGHDFSASILPADMHIPLETVTLPGNKNYIYTVLPQVPLTDIADAQNIAEVAHSVDFYDGLGRPVQSIAIDASPEGNDIISPVYYDSLNRETRSYLPYTLNSSNENITVHSDWKAKQENFYMEEMGFTANNDYLYSYSEVDLEESPFARMLEYGGSGNTGKIETDANGNSTRTGHTNRFEYYPCQESMNRYSYNYTDYKSASGYTVIPNGYSPRMLYYSRTTNKSDNIQELFIDKSGRTVCSRVYKDDGTALSTYNVYDSFGRLRCVIPPKANGTISGNTELCFFYDYDENGRLVKEKKPGEEESYLIYDKAGRPVMVQNAVLREGTAKNWGFTKYDAMNRPVMIGVFEDASAVSASRLATIKSDFKNRTGAYTAFYEAETSPGNIGYTLNNSYPSGYPVTEGEVNQIIYYDDYVMAGQDYGSAWYAANVQDAANFPNSQVDYRTNGLVTGGKTRVMDAAGNFLLSLAYYDKYGRVIAMYQTNQLNGTDIVLMEYNFAGRLLKSKHTQKVVINGQTVTTAEWNTYKYDHMGRLLATYHNIGATYATGILLASYSYDEMGRVTEENLHSEDNGASFQQSVDFKFNIQGWITGINNAALDGNGINLNDSKTDLFGMELNYTQALGTFKANYDGKITSIDSKKSGDTEAQRYAYTYDKLGRLTSEVVGNINSVPVVGAYSTTGIAYDDNGNITDLTRYNATGVATRQRYLYGTGTNRLLNVTFDGSAPTATTKTYRTNGALKSDTRKSISDIAYNQFNLTTDISFSSSNKLTFKYSATGTLLSRSKVNSSSQVVESTNYVSNFVYVTDATGTTRLDYLQMPFGRVVLSTGQWTYEYHLKDHLGNTRVAFTPGTTVPTVVQKLDYYAFGKQHEGNLQNGNLFRYNGKEQYEDYGLGWYNYGARMYDPELGNWHAPDPLAGNTPGISPYAYCYNNPISFVDPDGMVVDNPPYGYHEIPPITLAPTIERIENIEPINPIQFVSCNCNNLETAPLQLENLMSSESINSASASFSENNATSNTQSGSTSTAGGGDAGQQFDDAWNAAIPHTDNQTMDFGAGTRAGGMGALIEGVRAWQRAVIMHAVNLKYQIAKIKEYATSFNNNVNKIAEAKRSMSSLSGVPNQAQGGGGEKWWNKKLYGVKGLENVPSSELQNLELPTPLLVADIILSFINPIPGDELKNIKYLYRGSTGRVIARNLTEQLAMKEIMSNPAMGRVIKTGLKDARWSGWSKMAWNNAGVEIHYVGKFENGVLKAVDDFKFIGGQ